MKLSAGFMIMRLNVLVGRNLRADAIQRVVAISKGTVAASQTSLASARAGRDKGEAARGPEARTFSGAWVLCRPAWPSPCRSSPICRWSSRPRE